MCPFTKMKCTHKYFRLEATPLHKTERKPLLLGWEITAQLTSKFAGISCVQEEFLLLLTCLASKSISIVAHLRAPFIWTGEALVLMRKMDPAVRCEFVFL